jgi:hypothetical protein
MKRKKSMYRMNVHNSRNINNNNNRSIINSRVVLYCKKAKKNAEEKFTGVPD